MTKIISTKTHGVIDYLEGIVLLLAPTILGFTELGGPAVWIPWILGAGLIAYSLFTRYELGVIKVIPMRMHLAFDYAAGALLLVSPWLFGFADQPLRAWLPHVVVAIATLGVTAMTQPRPQSLSL